MQNNEIETNDYLLSLPINRKRFWGGGNSILKLGKNNIFITAMNVHNV